MSEPTIDQWRERFDKFQSEAVKNVVADYREKQTGRYLIVIPTGGGKTFTAVKAVNELYRQGIFDAGYDRVVWAAHRQELIEQADDEFEDFEKKNQEASFKNRVTLMMISGVTEHLKTHDDIRLVVIDEAHHAATANIQYGPIFDYPYLGILGLTATPSRHDGQPLEFERETYSIGFPDLIEKRIILSPEIRKIEGGRFEGVKAKGSGFSGLDTLGTEERDNRIIQHILDHHQDYTKIILYASSVKHTNQLYRRILDSPLASLYEAVDYITGANRFPLKSIFKMRI